ncbi:MAG: sulfatase-like hydrolase/transferase, partial [Nitrosopumilaceae archaeon]|nr:sulfatase-like hydrolase/transferase [Nitrosopumilaceae archaeon]NIX62873.1 sulfatase-like hydrolase/transferase [Nitrosopumilaceae archaeon]
MQFNKLIPIISPAFLLASIIGLVEAMGWILRGVSHSPNKAILYLLYASLGYGFLTIIFLLIFLSLSNKTTKHDTSLVANSFCIPIGMFIFALFISFLEGGRVQLFVFAPASLALSISVCLLFRKYIFSRFINLFSLQLMLIFHLVALSLSFLLICILFEVGIWALIGFLVFFLAVIFAITSIFSKRLRNNKLLFSLSNMVILVCLIFMLLGHSSSANFNLPRIILITIDTLRPDHLGSYGNKDVNTRNIDKLAAEGTQFNNALSPSPRTGPSHISILTGLYPKHHGAIDNGDWIADEVIALPEILSAQGYSTAAFVSGWTLKNQACGLRSRFHFYEENFSSWRFLPESIVKIRLYMAFLTIVGQFVSHPFEPE